MDTQSGIVLFLLAFASYYFSRRNNDRYFLWVTLFMLIGIGRIVADYFVSSVFDPPLLVLLISSILFLVTDLAIVIGLLFVGFRWYRKRQLLMRQSGEKRNSSHDNQQPGSPQGA
jgi:hypothetical protein